MGSDRLGGTGTEVSAVCLGTWTFGTDYGDGEPVDSDTSQAILTAAPSGGPRGALLDNESAASSTSGLGDYTYGHWP